MASAVGNAVVAWKVGAADSVGKSVSGVGPPVKKVGVGVPVGEPGGTVGCWDGNPVGEPGGLLGGSVGTPVGDAGRFIG